MLNHIVHFGLRLWKGLTVMNNEIVNVREIELNVEINGDELSPVIVFLHGFTGSTATWKEVTSHIAGRFRTVAVDLIGHGNSSIPEDTNRYSMEHQVEDLDSLFDKLSLDRFILVGYSMGGRVALAYTIKHPGRVASLILESASPGLKTQEERAARRDLDRKMAERILLEGMSSFVDFWENIPLFDSQKKLPDVKRKAIRKERLGQSVIGLSNSLLGIGTGSQQSYWDILGSINIPTLLITGKIDTKFVKISREIKKSLPKARHLTIAGVGHAIHVEKPVLFATMIEEHVTELKNRGGTGL